MNTEYLDYHQNKQRRKRAFAKVYGFTGLRTLFSKSGPLFSLDEILERMKNLDFSDYEIKDHKNFLEALQDSEIGIASDFCRAYRIYACKQRDSEDTRFKITLDPMYFG